MKNSLRAAATIVFAVALSTTTQASSKKTCDGRGFVYHVEDNVFGITSTTTTAHRIIKKIAGRPARTRKIEILKSLKHGHSWFNIDFWLIAPPKKFENITTPDQYHEKFELHTKFAKITGKINTYVFPKTKEQRFITLRITGDTADLTEMLREIKSDTNSFKSDAWLILRRYYRFRINQRGLVNLINRATNVTHDQTARIRNGNCDDFS